MGDSGEPRLARTISCFAFNGDKTQIAVSPSDNTIEIWQVNTENTSKWTKLHTLTEHDSYVSDIDWSPVTNLIVSAAHDRNAYVWTLEGNQWKPTLVILRINRAAISCRWSPRGDKFAVGSGAKVVPVCHYEKGPNWWVSKMIKKHKSSILSVDWHPNNKFLLTGGTDFKCRIFSAFVPDVDDNEDENVFASMFPNQFQFGSLLAEFDTSRGWIERCIWSPGGFRAAFIGHDSCICFVSLESGSPVVQRVNSEGLPFLAIGFLDDNNLVAVGHNPNPKLFSANGAEWGYVTDLDKKKVKKAVGVGSRFGAAKALFSKAASQGLQQGHKQSTSLATRHQNAVTEIRVLDDSNFVTAGNDGRILFWHMAEIMK